MEHILERTRCQVMSEQLWGEGRWWAVGGQGYLILVPGVNVVP